jgi:hypothetical protein
MMSRPSICAILRQRRIIDAYAGPIQEFVIEGGGHEDFVSLAHHGRYIAAMNAFKEQWA